MAERKFSKQLDYVANYLLGISAIYLAIILSHPSINQFKASVISFAAFGGFLCMGLIIKKYNLTKYID